MLAALATTLTLSVTMKNQALVFLKPHAANDACDAFLKQHLEQAGITVTSSGIKRAAEIDEQKLIDQHYGSLADLAMGVQPGDMAVSPAALQAFEDAYGLKWAQALPSMLRNDDALAQLGVDGLGLEAMWRAGKQLKLAPGTRDSRIDGVTQTDFHDFESCADRNAFVAPGAEVRYLVCEWDQALLSWAAFRQSAGPLEGLKERCASLASDPLAEALLAGGVGRATLETVRHRGPQENSVVSLGDAKADKVFDLTEEMGAAECVALCCGA
ncbi:hypothetical protein EMIHUDRAFT_238909 [Emiliania huxleyi CCMP1516]|uniref:Nucleoside diphosphate kinase-like domain-containing protein n=2 Tax=Emiliania huxleyi TaxID=2903 RepID=A0A0D3JKY6_EMIH1|nr:hypothetical protein EMIHUDRAFT_238909 [Emiliania huxleyi CCMP1516]EOD24171.1 hypothetical protein EMIHUDRAFT_238909 [Emiliania huxleyi CCMP1516]|eukprot:XP_005776600.1 hypothetical protein EMIHUDRAFT_238909 [Emiliania huxleyi CCMP1516]